LSSLFRSVEEKFIGNSFCRFVVAKINTSEQMCGIVHQFKILNPFQFHRPNAVPEEFPQKNEWEEDNFQNDFQNTHDEQIGKLDEVHPSLPPPCFMQERQNDVAGKDT
jgi:hypothetical protein